MRSGELLASRFEIAEHSASSAQPFGIMVWGLATYASYAYPAGARAVPINGVVVPAVP